MITTTLPNITKASNCSINYFKNESFENTKFAIESVRDFDLDESLLEKIMAQHVNTNIMYDISQYQKLSSEFLIRNSDKIIWYNLCAFQVIPEEILENIVCYLNDNHLNMALINNTKISINFLEKYQDRIDFSKTISKFYPITVKLLKTFKDKLDWYFITKRHKFSKKYIEEYKDYVDWNIISRDYKLSEEFIEEYKDFVNWSYISRYQKLSIEFIEKYSNRIHFSHLSDSQILPDNFIYKYCEKLLFINLCSNQKLTESFMREFSHLLDWYFLAKNQDLSEQFIKDFLPQLAKTKLIACHKLSEEILDEIISYEIQHKNSLFNTFTDILKHQNHVSSDFILKHLDLMKKHVGHYKVNILISNYMLFTEDEFKKLGIKDYKQIRSRFGSWVDYDFERKLKAIKSYKRYEVVDDKYIIAYKTTDFHGRSIYNRRFRYEVGNEYESSCDYVSSEQNSFGLSAWTKGNALAYHSQGKLFKVRINIEDLGCMVKSSRKLRCKKITVIEEIPMKGRHIL